MTIIVGLVHEGTVYLAADSCATDGSEIIYMTAPKVWKAGEWVFGVSGSLPFDQIVRYLVHVEPPSDQDMLPWLVGTYMPALREACERHKGFDSDGTFGGGILLGAAGRLFRIDDSGGVVECRDGCEAIGSGSRYALGVLFGLEHDDPVYRLHRAVAGAGHYDVYCGGETVIVQTGGET